MKKYYLLLTFLIISFQLYSQDKSWVYRVHYEKVKEHADSLHRFTNIYMDVNPAVILDSSRLTFIIGNSAGSKDILEKKIIYTQSIVNGRDVIAFDGYIQFFLGRYSIKKSPKTPFVVDLLIDPPRKSYVKRAKQSDNQGKGTK
jgi:hypothetical protein